MYFTVVMMMSVHTINDNAPRIASGPGCVPADVEHDLQRVERTGADVAKHHTKSAQAQCRHAAGRIRWRRLARLVRHGVSPPRNHGLLQIALALGLGINHVPYIGGGPATAAVLAGHAPIGIVALAAAPRIQASNLRALVVLSKTRIWI